MGRGLVVFAIAFVAACNGSSSTSDALPNCAGGLQRCGDKCVDLDTDLGHCGACGHSCPGPYDTCSAGQCHLGPACGSDAPACITEHGAGECCAGVCVGNPDMVMCLPLCTSSNQCANTGCCAAQYDGRGACEPPVATQYGCLCAQSSDCPSGQVCAPAASGANVIIPGRMICKPNDGALYDGCEGTTTCSDGCCVADAHGNQFCATACADSTTCGAAHCDTYDFSHGSCAGPTACGP